MRNYKLWRNLCAGSFIALAALAALTPWEVWMLRVSVGLAVAAVVFELMNDRQECAAKLDKDIDTFREDARVFWAGIRTEMGPRVAERWKNGGSSRASIEGGIRENLFRQDAPLPPDYEHRLGRMRDVLEKWDKDSKACRAAGQRLAARHDVTLSLLRVASEHLAERDGLQGGDYSFIDRVREAWQKDSNY